MSKKVIRLTESELMRYIQKIISEQSTSSPYRVGQVLQGERDLDNQMYTIKITRCGDGWVMAKIKGPGSYEQGGKQYPMNGNGEYELNSYTPGKLSGNSNMGEFTIIKSMNEQNSPDYYMDPEQNPERYAAADQPTNTTPKQIGEPIVPYEMKGPSAPTSSISPEDLAKSIAGIAKAQKGANFLNYIRKWGHTSKDTWDDATIGGYAPYTSPQLKAQAQKGGYFPFPNMASKRADDAKRGNNVQQRPTPQMTFRVNPNLSFDQNVYIIQQQIRRELTPKEKSQIDKSLIDAKTRSSLIPTPQQERLIVQLVRQKEQNLRRNLTQAETDEIKAGVMRQR